jgi:hypothetical protein
MLFDTPTPFGFHVRCRRAHWEFIVKLKTSFLAGRAKEVEDTLRDPDQVRRSRKDPAVFFFYRGGPRAAFVLPRGAKMMAAL